MNLAGRVDTRLKCVLDCAFAVGHLSEVGEPMSDRCHKRLITLGTRALKRIALSVPASLNQRHWRTFSDNSIPKNDLNLVQKSIQICHKLDG